jgi:HK97 family phage major capsid protein
MLSDAPAIQAYLNSRLSLFVRQEEEAQLLNGAGNFNNFLGLLARVPAANRFVVSDADAPNAADHVYEAITVAQRSYLEPDAIVLNPVDWADLRLLKDTTENYVGGSPFGNGQPRPGQTLWDKRVVVTTAIEQGLALVGAFGTGAQLFRRGGLTVEASNSHEDFFRRDLVASRSGPRRASRWRCSGPKRSRPLILGWPPRGFRKGRSRWDRNRRLKGAGPSGSGPTLSP